MQIEGRQEDQSDDTFSGSMKSWLTNISSPESFSEQPAPLLDNFRADSLRG